MRPLSATTVVDEQLASNSDAQIVAAEHLAPISALSSRNNHSPTPVLMPTPIIATSPVLAPPPVDHPSTETPSNNRRSLCPTSLERKRDPHQGVAAMRQGGCVGLWIITDGDMTSWPHFPIGRPLFLLSSWCGYTLFCLFVHVWPLCVRLCI
jgi:hypothetical protein